jgi:CheY-like chemotaxis protein
MTTRDVPAVLFVDDEPERLYGLRALLEDLGARTDAADPADLDADQLDGVHLVSVDQFLGDRWGDYLLSPDGPSSEAARPSDGIAVAAALNSRLRAAGHQAAVSLHTAEIDRLGEHLPREQREPLLAAGHDLDWVFRFDQDAGPRLAARMTALAAAIAALPGAWDPSGPDFGTSWLRLPAGRPWTDYAVQQVEDCRPPSHGLSANSHGRSLVRWFAQRILPYPAFLLDRAHAAVLLGVEAESLADEEGDALDACRYQGPLAEFNGRRWWRAGLQDLLYEAGSDETDSPGERAAAVGRALGRHVVQLPQTRPVVGYDSHGRQLPEPLEHALAVRLQPDGWPVFADDPWTAKSAAAADPAVRALVVHADRQNLAPS